jgi:hypothetical protein
MRTIMKIRPALLLLAMLLLSPLASATQVTYVYDGAGRLVMVDYGSGKGFVYTYDAMGNLLSRTPLPPTPPHRRSTRAAKDKPASTARTAR